MVKVKVMELFILFMFWSLLNSTFVLAEVSLAKPGCPEMCGNVTIPYPFGIGNDCFLKADEWFEIECRNTSESTYSKPFLKKPDLEVLQIKLPHANSTPPIGLARVNLSVLSSSCQGTRSVGAPVNFTGSTFVFSHIKNTFVTAGCDRKATLILTDKSAGADNNCSASCSTCCQTVVPASLNAFNVSFNSTGAQDTCAYAFLADKEWLRSNSCVSDMKDLDKAPVFLEWSVLDYMIPGLDQKERTVGFYFSCGSDINQNGNQTLRCYCDNGYEGNPYLEKKCIDIDECLVMNIKCNGTDWCENTGGSYHCTRVLMPMSAPAPMPLPKKSNNLFLGLGLGLGFGLLILSAGVWLSFKFTKKRIKLKNNKRIFKRNGGLVLQKQLSSSQGLVEKPNIFTSKELEMATDSFNSNRVVGRGGQGTVYKGMLPDGKIVAIKKSKIDDDSKIEPFINEVVILSQINHRNIVKLLGCCLETDVPLLVYEFVPNGTLSSYLHDKEEDFQMSWEMRLRVATEVACALSYLHSSASLPIFHRDIKSSNILLDDKFRAKIADFGTSRSVDIEKTHLTTLVHGTFGYLDPEYFQTSQFNDKSDVYSFGVVLVELLTGQRAISAMRSIEGRSLATYFITAMERDEVFEILDAKVVGEGRREEVVAVANLAKRCLDWNGKNRPTMREVTKELEGIGVSGDGGFEEVELVRTQEVEPWDVTTGGWVGCVSPDSRPNKPFLRFSTPT